MDSITIRLDEALSQKLEQNLKPYYSTKTEFIREAIRDKLKQIETEEIIRQLKRLQGSVSVNDIKILTTQERRALAEEFIAKVTKENFA